MTYRRIALGILALAVASGLVSAVAAGGYSPPGTSPDPNLKNVFVTVIGPGYVRPGQLNQYEFDVNNSTHKVYKTLTLDIFLPKQQIVSQKLYVQEGVIKGRVQMYGQHIVFNISHVRETDGLTAYIYTRVLKTARGNACNTLHLRYAPGKVGNYPTPCIPVLAQ